MKGTSRIGCIAAALSLVLLLPTSASAQFRERIKISNVRLGFPAAGFGGQRGGAFKAGQWAPVYLDLECVKDTDPEENLVVIVETQDADEAVTEGSIEIPPMKKDERLTASELGRIPYLIPGSIYANVNVRVKGAKSGRTYGESSDRNNFTGLDTPQFVLLGVGTNLSGMRFPVDARGQDEGPATRSGWVQTAHILDVGLLPDHWIGYGAVDLMILGTGADKDFWLKLAEPQHEKRRKAISEWVRRGGRLIISVGANQDVLEALKELKDLLPVAVPAGGKRMVPRLAFKWTPSGVYSVQSDSIGSGAEFPVATLQPKPDRTSHALLIEDGTNRPWALQGSFGQGRVTVFAFDLDKPPFADFARRVNFWENLVNFAGYTMPPLNDKLDRGYGSSNTKYDEFGGKLQGSLDFFEGVPVVSFGWVALFILIYIILIGPVDYLFLKKVLRRLEWTWITFPVIVIAVSAAAYFAAYALKGKDLKINKVDVVDVDLAGKRVDGNTWFTLFSPRIQNYTIGVEPAGTDKDPSAWTPALATDAARDTVVTWHSHIDQIRFSSGSNLGFKKSYRFQSGTDPVDVNRDLYAAGLEGVPIQVWTTKAFHAEWSAPIDPAKPPVAGELTERENLSLVGSLTNYLPIEQYSDVALLWRGTAFPLPNEFPTGMPKAISVSAQPGSGGVETAKTWVNSPKRLVEDRRHPVSGPSGSPNNPIFRLWQPMFSDSILEAGRSLAPNASMRRLDQSWRVSQDHPEQAVLVLRIPTREGQAEEVTRAGDSPSRLWLGELPTSGAKRPALLGTLKQETYIRVFIPVKTLKK
jgi:hypothetical protein